MNQDELAKAERIIALNDKFKGAYFFTPPSSASERRRYEAIRVDNNRLICSIIGNAPLTTGQI